jgi:hypothetical protein
LNFRKRNKQLDKKEIENSNTTKEEKKTLKTKSHQNLNDVSNRNTIEWILNPKKKIIYL